MTTYKYFKPDTVLRAAYGGATILDNGDSAERSKMTLMLHHISRQIGWPSGFTRYISEIGTDGVDEWVEVSDNLYTGISAHLSTAELTSVVSSKPAGYNAASTQIGFQPYPDKTNIFVWGDSIPSGAGTTKNDLEDTYIGQALDELDTMVWSTSSPTREGVGNTYAVFSMAMGSGSYGNTSTSVNPNVNYPEVLTLSYEQRMQTLAINGGNNIMILAGGTNDIAYDAAIDGSDTWLRAATRITALRAEFPNLIIVVANIIKRGTDLTYGDDFATDATANYISAGANIIMDLNTAFGDADEATYQPDNTHPNTLGHGLMKTEAKRAILAAAALL